MHEQAVTRAPATRWKKRARRQARFLQAYARKGTLTAGARAAGVSWTTMRHWIASDSSFRSRCMEARSAFEDRLRELLWRRARLGDGAMLIFLARLELLGLYQEPSVRYARQAREDENNSRWEEVRRHALEYLRRAPVK